MTFRKDSILPELQIEKIVHKGLGLGYYEGVPVFVYQGLPGDDVAVRIIHKRGGVFFAEIYSYNKRSEYQIPVECEVFKVCGGCDWLHVAYEDQLKFKQIIIREFYERLCPDSDMIEDIIPSVKVNFYRNKVFLPVTQYNNDLIAGIYARRSHKVIPHRICFLQPPGSDEIIRDSLRLMTKARVTSYNERKQKGVIRHIGLRYSQLEKKFLVIFVTAGKKFPFSRTICQGLTEKYPQINGIIQNINEAGSNRILGEKTIVLSGSEFLNEKIGEITYKIHYKSFFQVNTELTKEIFDYVSSQMTPQDIVLDAYSGIGAIGIYIAGKVKKVYCLEQQKEAVRDGRDICRKNSVENCMFINCLVEDEIASLPERSSANTIILDPPRKGLTGKTVDKIADSQISKIIYISCDIATQRRDIEMFIYRGFQIKRIQPFDMFPHTFHIENIVVLHR